jgi:uncharacterized damage-inducible protein DinB
VSVEELDDARRTEPPFMLGERDMLEGWLEYQRITLLIKCEGLDDEQRKRRPVASSLLSLHGLLRHMAEVERGWFLRTLAEEPIDLIWPDPTNEDAEIYPIDDADWEEDLAAWERECAASRSVAASRSLDATGLRDGLPCSLRWIYNHMIEEYARHNGHADLIREMVDGSVGY